MSLGRPCTHAADPRRVMPQHAGTRLDEAERARISLADEELRLARLGFTPAAERCRLQRRYWEFVSALLSLEQAPAVRLAR